MNKLSSTRKVTPPPQFKLFRSRSRQNSFLRDKKAIYEPEGTSQNVSFHLDSSESEDDLQSDGDREIKESEKQAQEKIQPLNIDELIQQIKFLNSQDREKVQQTINSLNRQQSPKQKKIASYIKKEVSEFVELKDKNDEDEEEIISLTDSEDEEEDEEDSEEEEESDSEAQSKQQQEEAEISHYEFKRGEVFKQIYVAIELLGEGTFGRVIKVLDSRNNKYFAMKIVRAMKRHTENAKIEAEILQAAHSLKDPPNEEVNIVQLYDHFLHNQNYCMIFELLGPSVYDILQFNKFTGFTIQEIRIILQDILEALSFLHDINLTHTDLKPENIIFRSIQTKKNFQGRVMPDNLHIKIIDFGGATFEDQYHSKVINTRQYRAPEVILSCQKWNEKSDIWGVACIVAELFTGSLFFKTRKDDYEHLAMIEKQCGPIPYSMINEIKNETKEHFFQQLPEAFLTSSYLKWPLSATKENTERVNQMKTIDQIFSKPKDTDQINLRDLLKKMLVIKPKDRISAYEAIQHPFFQRKIQEKKKTKK